MREPYIGAPVTRIPVTDRSEIVPVGPICDHIRALMGIGMTKNMIVRSAGVTKIVVTRLMAGEQKTTRKVVSDAILGVDGRPSKHQALVLNVGCRRRLGGLMVLGYSSSFLAELVGSDDSHIRTLTRKPHVSWNTHITVKSVFESLGVDGGSARARLYAARRGFVHPLWWEDIDDPFEVPTVPSDSGLPDLVVVERLVEGRAVAASAADKCEAFRRLVAAGSSVSAAAVHLGINYRTALRYSEMLVAA